jgi:hypothetical protein
MNRRSVITVFALFVLCCLPSIASADGIVNWTFTATVQDLDLTGPGTTGTASGSFTYDLSTNKFSAINIITPATLEFAGATYTSLISSASIFTGSSSTGMILGKPSGDLTDSAILFLMFADDGLANSSHMISLIGVGEGTCNDMTCSNPTELRLVTSGEGVGIPLATPEPSTFSLVGMGLVALLAGAAIRKVLLA